MDEANAAKLSDALKIIGIPRFLIVDAAGKVLDPDAKRPSDPDIEKELSQIAK